MKKVLLSGIMCFVLTATLSARNDVKDFKQLRHQIAPCGGFITVKDREGKVVYSEIYGSNATSRPDCSDGFLRHLETIMVQYPATNYSYETDVSWWG